MKRVLRWFCALVVVAMLAVAAGTFIPYPLLPMERADPADGRRILVLSNAIHTDIAIPLDAETRAAYAFLSGAGLPVANLQAEWLVIGWGGRSFYLETPTWGDLKPMPVFRALTVDRSVMHVDVSGPIDEANPAVVPFDLAPVEFGRLTAFIQSSFVKTTGDLGLIPGAGYGSYDQFFEAHGRFNALVGCNTWTARALRTAGLRTGLWNPLPQTLTLSLRLFN